MFKLDLRVNAKSLSEGLHAAEAKHLPFALVLTATRLGQRVKKGSLTIMSQRLDRPTPTTMKSLFVKAATKSAPARVYFKDSWASGVPADAYLQMAVFGGLRRHKRFEQALIAQGFMRKSQYAVPTKDFLNQYGNVSRGTMMKILSGLKAAETVSGFQANASDSARSRKKGNAARFFAGKVDGTNGIWERKEMAMGTAVRPVFIFSASAPGYRVIFPFFKVAENIVKANYSRELTSAFEYAMSTAK